MPQVNRLSESFRGQPVVVLAMSIDKDEKDARIVRDAMKLGYPVLRAEEVATKYGVQGYPTMFVIGPDGVFREMHVGYSPKLFDELSTVIRGLLPRAGR
jgi:peroxiredoxin